jgi:NAD-dependent SIR2 family protein deacetylase
MAKITKHKRNCPICDRPIYYKSRQGLETGEVRNTKCHKCGKKGIKNGKGFDPDMELVRACPGCGSRIEYSTAYGYVKAIRNDCECRSCVRAKRKGSAPAVEHTGNFVSVQCHRCLKIVDLNNVTDKPYIEYIRKGNRCKYCIAACPDLESLRAYRKVVEQNRRVE